MATTIRIRKPCRLPERVSRSERRELRESPQSAFLCEMTYDSFHEAPTAFVANEASTRPRHEDWQLGGG